MTRHLSQHTARAFTVIELLTVIFIMGLIVGISFPMMSKMIETTSQQMAQNTVDVVVAGTRAYATRNKYFLADLDPSRGGVQSSQNLGDGYSGAAVIVTPANEMRLVENIEGAKRPDGTAMELPFGTNYAKNGYADLEGFDYIALPSRSRVLGIFRNRISGNLELLPPPFAITFDRNGSLVLRTDITVTQLRSEGWVYYDGDGDGKFDYTSARNGSYDLADWSGDNDANKLDDGRNMLPFEKIEPVIGVIVYVAKEMPSSLQPTTTAAIDASAPFTDDVQWLFDNGKVMLFSRYTGANVSD